MVCPMGHCMSRLKLGVESGQKSFGYST
jgi:hypothetical protein